MLTPALNYAARGWQVFPLAPGQKRPHPALAPHGLHDATGDPDRICSWWERCPRANVAIRMGTNSGLVVVDVDGTEGAENFIGLQHEHRAVPDTLWATTPRGGWHAYFVHPGGEIPNTAGKLGVGIDTRGDGGYVVAPPSTRRGGRWSWWEVGTSPAPLPGWLHRLLLPTVRRDRAPEPLEISGESSYVRAALSRETRAVAGAVVGTRNDTLNRAAFNLGTLVGAGLLDGVDAVVGLEYAAASCGLPSWEARRTIRSGLRAGKANPREVRR